MGQYEDFERMARRQSLAENLDKYRVECNTAKAQLAGLEHEAEFGAVACRGKDRRRLQHRISAALRGQIDYQEQLLAMDTKDNRDAKLVKVERQASAKKTLEQIEARLPKAKASSTSRQYAHAGGAPRGGGLFDVAKLAEKIAAGGQFLLRRGPVPARFL